MKKRSKGKVAAGVIGLILVFLAIAFIGYTSDYYRASAEVEEYMLSQNKVEPVEIDQGMLLDGPGEEKALIFYPGAKVEYTAYLPLLCKIAADGTDVFLVRMPLNLAVFGIKKADKVIGSYGYDEWYLGGHSLGGAMAAAYVSETDKPVKGLMMLAAYPVKEIPAIQVLELYGSKDLILNREKLAEGGAYLPSKAVVMEIPGANHAQFGNYGAQKGDGEAEIPWQVQQEVTVQMADEMLGQEHITDAPSESSGS